MSEARAEPVPRAGRSLLLATLAIAVLSALMHIVNGYGTVLYQFIVFSAAGILDRWTPIADLDQAIELVWIAAAVLNLLVFLLPAAILYFALRRRAPMTCQTAIWTWCAVYGLSLFVLFPAADGP